MHEIVFDASLGSILQDRACDKCREHKLKCGRRAPCATCQRKATACFYGSTPTSHRKRRRAETLDRNTSAIAENASVVITPSQHALQQELNSGTSDQQVSSSEQSSATTDQQNPLQHWTGDQIINVFDYADLWHDADVSGEVSLDFGLFSETASSESFWPASINMELVERLVQTFLAQINPSMPVMRPAILEQGLASGRFLRERDFAAFLLAVCAFVCLQSHAATRSAALAKQFLTEALSLYNTANLGESPSVETLLACFLIFGSLWTLGLDNAAWLRLQEVINLARLWKLDHLESPEQDQDWQAKTQLYFGLVVVERAFAACRDHRILLPKPNEHHFATFSNLSAELETDEQKNAAALRILVRSFGQIDDELLVCWRNRCENTVRPGFCDRLSRRSIARILQSFPGSRNHDWRLLMRSSYEATHNLDDIETAKNERGDVLLTSIWLQNRFWHLALTHGLLSANDTCQHLRFDFASVLARQTLEICKNFKISSFESHGQGLAEKVFDVASDHLGIMQCLHGNTVMHDEFPQSVEEVLPPGPPIVREAKQPSDTPVTILSTEAPGAEGLAKKQPALTDFEVATGLLGFLAIFNNGQNAKFKQYLTKYHNFVADGVRIT